MPSKSKLVPPSGRGFMRNDDGGWYDSQEWVFVDLRTANAMRMAGDADADGLLGWITDQGSENFDLISELHDATTADYAGEMPMVGFGAGAYSIALWARENPDAFLPCGEYASEELGDGGVSPDGGSGGAKAKDDGSDDGGCGCNTVGSTPGTLGALFGLIALAAAALRRFRGGPAKSS